MPSRTGSGSKKRASTTKKKTTKKKTTKKTTTKKTASTKSTTAVKRTSTRQKPSVSVKPRATQLRIRQVRSGIGFALSYRRTLTALGLKHHQDEVVLPDNASVRGMLRKVHHLVAITSEGANG